MRLMQLTVNGEHIAELVEPRTHLGDLLRDKLLLTATHLRCEQGVCGACTVLLDGEPARSCITYAVMCEQADVTTLEGLEDDPVITALRGAFSAEHALQCGYCTPGMLITARDIVLRLPDADERRIREELSGNLCRCTGYGGIVRAVARVLAELRSGALAVPASQARTVGPVGSRRIAITASPTPPAAFADTPVRTDQRDAAATEYGLGSRQPNLEIRHSFLVHHSPEKVWTFFEQVERVVPCLPGASLVGVHEDGRIQARIAVKLGPIMADFTGEGRLTRDDGRRRGWLAGSGRDRLGGSRASAELEFQVLPADGGASRIDIGVRALLSGPLARFGRSGIVEDLASRVTDAFAENIERQLAGGRSLDHIETGSSPLRAGSLIWAVLKGRIRRALDRMLGKSR